MSDAPHPESRARMVDVTDKAESARSAVASCVVEMSEPTRTAIRRGDLEKGDALEVARVAGIMAAKRTAELIPLCHPIALGAVALDFEDVDGGIAITARVRTTERTGVEMEALTAATVAALTIYDMVKGLERGVTISQVKLREKRGGRSGDWTSSH